MQKHVAFGIHKPRWKYLYDIHLYYDIGDKP